jgi:hypothetical protein
MVDSTTGNLLIVILAIAATTGILILIAIISIMRHTTTVHGTHVIF